MARLDSRTVKTNQKIVAAMIQLCQDQFPFANLTTSKIAGTAGISRQTFYRHYLGPKDVIKSLIDTHLQEFLTQFSAQHLSARSLTTRLMAVWQKRPTVLYLVEWAGMQIEFIQAMAGFNLHIAQQNQVALIDLETVCKVYAAATYMILRDYVLTHKLTKQRAVDLLLQLTDNMKQIY
ncbi:TetR/AcrR family transcriptional regulator [Secundilactobacillus folii]|uniref:HTH tetR-type domain-containing protein n=1 Tax=Secundilactobacillus folii TaxID=2678357 RepID=A0A7X3C385_9LACO|nr:TetR/AcrR family transcriptional regulator [Secundilactobacillus folii]MTV82262.1 hypothetical protein [Secundilactobacillus folii]